MSLVEKVHALRTPDDRVDATEEKLMTLMAIASRHAA